MNYAPRKDEEFFITYQVTFRTNDRVENFSKHRAHVTKELELQFGSSLVEVSPPHIIGNIVTKASDKKTTPFGRISSAIGNFLGVNDGEEE